MFNFLLFWNCVAILILILIFGGVYSSQLTVLVGCSIIGLIIALARE